MVVPSSVTLDREARGLIDHCNTSRTSSGALCLSGAGSAVIIEAGAERLRRCIWVKLSAGYYKILLLGDFPTSASSLRISNALGCSVPETPKQFTRRALHHPGWLLEQVVNRLASVEAPVGWIPNYPLPG
ncbi:MAG TPA: hypothetical protein V6D03_06485 [Candidatus Caenarcaniphilales bacterium]